MSKKKQTTQNLTLVEWCDQQNALGHKLAIKWDGGGDSGWVYFEIDGETVENEYTERLVDFMYNHLDYGSWAGEFQASGEAVYDPKEKGFVGADYYSEDSTVAWKVNHEIRIPKSIWFDNFLFAIDGYESPAAQFSFFIKNGFMTPEHDAILRKLEQETDIVIDRAVEEFQEEYEFRSIWESTNIPRAEFKEDGDDLVYLVEHLDLGTEDGHEKDICLYVTDIDEQIKESEEE